MSRDWINQDFYAVLGVIPSASAEEIRQTYHRLARRYHPDANQHDPTAEAKFKEISQAYSVLSKPKRRAEYDRLRSLSARTSQELEDQLEEDFLWEYRPSTPSPPPRSTYTPPPPYRSPPSYEYQEEPSGCLGGILSLIGLALGCLFAPVIAIFRLLFLLVMISLPLIIIGAAIGLIVALISAIAG